MAREHAGERTQQDDCDNRSVDYHDRTAQRLSRRHGSRFRHGAAIGVDQASFDPVDLDRRVAGCRTLGRVLGADRARDGTEFDSWSAGVQAQFDPILNPYGGWLFGMVLVAVLGVTSVTSEYGSRMIRTSFIVNPRRNQVFAAKATIVTLLGVAISAITIPGMFLISQPIYRFYGLETDSVTDHDAARFLIIAGIMDGLFILIPFSFAWLLRGAASAITISLGFAVLPCMLTPIVPLWVQENMFRYLPENARDGLIGVLKIDAPTYLHQTPAIIVVALWFAGSVAAAAVTMNRRDV